MAEALKHLLGPKAVDWLAEALAAASPGFDRSGFAAACAKGLGAMELKPRIAHIAGCMGRFLPEDFPEAARILARSLGPEVPATGENGSIGLRYFPHDSFIAQFGLDHPEAAFSLMEKVTRRGTCEFSIRVFLERHPQLALAQMHLWAQSPDAHLRRLASEGSRPRLPWAPRLRSLQRDPAPCIALLERLKDDPVRYVQRSVANHLNDISKDHPDRAVALCAEWAKGAGPERRWIIAHALRLLVKQGHHGALSVLGAGAPPEVTVLDVTIDPPSLRIGGRLRVSMTINSVGQTPQDLIADMVVHYVKANGRTSAKVFKLRRQTLAPGQAMQLSKTLSLADMTTRKHHPGRHVVEVQANGQSFALGAFDLLP